MLQLADRIEEAKEQKRVHAAVWGGVQGVCPSKWEVGLLHASVMGVPWTKSLTQAGN